MTIPLPRRGLSFELQHITKLHLIRACFKDVVFSSAFFFSIRKKQKRLGRSAELFLFLFSLPVRILDRLQPRHTFSHQRTSSPQSTPSIEIGKRGLPLLVSQFSRSARRRHPEPRPNIRYIPSWASGACRPARISEAFPSERGSSLVTRGAIRTRTVKCRSEGISGSLTRGA